MRSRIELGADDRVLILAPHPDDETLATGGLIQHAVESGAAVHVLFLTDGDNNPWVQRVAERRWLLSPRDRSRFAARRRREARNALRVLTDQRISTTFAHYPDQGLTAHLFANPTPLLDEIVAVIEAEQPTVLVAPSALDTHPDHNALAVLVPLALARATGVRPRRLSYVVHGRRHLPERLGTALVVMNDQQHRRKWLAACAHKTQISCHRRMFARIAREAETYLAQADDDAALASVHPLRDAVVGQNTLWLDLRPRARMDALGRARLRMLLEKDDHTLVPLSLELRWRSDVVPLESPVVTIPPIEVNLRPRRRGGFVQIPLRALEDGRRLYVKLDRSIGFFDEAGWATVTLPAHLISFPRDVAKPAIALARRKPNVCAVVPCYNVASLCGPVVQEAIRHATHMVVVDDGSTDGTGRVLGAVAAKNRSRITVLTLKENSGKGTALIHAFRHAIAHLPFDVLVTLDGDGQHRPDDIPLLVSAYLDGAEFVIGERTRMGAMPLRSRVGNVVMRRMLTRMFPGCPDDTQSGLRAFDRDFLHQSIDQLRLGRYETELQMLLLAIRQGRRIATVPIPTLYFDRNRSSHFRPVADSVKIYTSLLRDLRSHRRRPTTGGSTDGSSIVRQEQRDSIEIHPQDRTGV